MSLLRRSAGLTAGDLYLNEKLPFGFNYVGHTLNIVHDLDQQGEHGSHVAGIAAANRYLPSYGGGSDQYETMFGTSMAAPQVTGMAALLAQVIREWELSAVTGLSPRHLAQSLLMSTAKPLFEEAAGGSYYPLLRQGAGLARVDLAAQAESFVLVPGQDDCKVKAELGDDPRRTGVYEFDFTITNITGSDAVYTLDADLFRQDVFEYLSGSGIWLLDNQTTDLPADVTFCSDSMIPQSTAGHDLNGDGRTNAADADHLLEYAVGNETELHAQGDLSGDGLINSYDAHLDLPSLPRAAEYVGGYVFIITDDSSLCVASDEDLSITQRISPLDPTDRLQITFCNDLAYNYADGRLYVQYYSNLNREMRPYLAVINMDDGTLEPVCELPQDVNTMAIDSQGNFYSAAYDSSLLYTYTLSQVTGTYPTMTQVGYMEDYKSSYLSNMAWDHNEGRLYWAYPNKLLQIDPKTAAVTRIGPSPDAYVDLAPAPGQPGNSLMAGFGGNVLNVDAETGDYHNWYYMFANNLVGIAYVGTQEYKYGKYDTMVDWYFIIDRMGYVYLMGFLEQDGKYYYLEQEILAPRGIYTKLDFEMETQYFSSAYFDGEMLYFSAYRRSRNDVTLMAIDVAGGSRTCYELGTFADGVWPVAGLMESGELRNHIGIITGAQGIQALSQPRPVEQPTQTKGGLHSAAVPMSFPEVGTDRVQVDVTLPTAGTNADMTVFFDSTATAPPSQRPPAPRAASPPTPASAATATLQS